MGIPDWPRISLNGISCDRDTTESRFSSHERSTIRAKSEDMFVSDEVTLMPSSLSFDTTSDTVCISDIPSLVKRAQFMTDMMQMSLEL